MADTKPFLSHNDDDTESDVGLDFDTCTAEANRRRASRPRPCFHWKELGLLFSTASTLILAFLLYRSPHGSSEIACPNLRKSAIDSSIDEARWLPSLFVSNYSSAGVAGMEQVDQNWDAIVATHGIVAVDHQWAAERGLPRADSLIRDPSRGVYTLEAYHSLHCLVIIRRTMFQLARGEPLDAPVGHSTHCFDGLLQAIMCNADDTLLYNQEHVSAGDGQMRRCRNWAALRDWAGQHSACYVDSRAGVSHEDATQCSTGDGLIVRGE